MGSGIRAETPAIESFYIDQGVFGVKRRIHAIQADYSHGRKKGSSGVGGSLKAAIDKKILIEDQRSASHYIWSHWRGSQVPLSSLNAPYICAGLEMSILVGIWVWCAGLAHQKIATTATTHLYKVSYLHIVFLRVCSGPQQARFLSS